MAYGYSDIFMISKEKLLEIARICGVFAAMNLFAEIAIPTSIILTVKKEQVVNIDQTNYISKIYWDGIQEFEEEYKLDLNMLFSNWEANVLYKHPVKLSKWKSS